MNILVEIEGMTPLMLNRFTDEAAQAATSSTRTSAVGDRGTPREQAEKALYVSNDGHTPIVPGPNLFRCIIDAGTFFKAGRSKVTTQKSSLIPACVTINEVELPIISRDGWEVDTRPVRIPATGGRILAYRPLFNDWKLKFTADLDTDIIAPKLFRDIVDAAGKRIGLGAFRPNLKGQYGRFVVTSWAVEKEKPARKHLRAAA